MPNCEFCGKEIAEGQKCECEKAAAAIASDNKKSPSMVKKIVVAVVGLIIIIDLISAASTAAIRKPVKQYFKALNKMNGEILGKTIYDEDIVDDDVWDNIDEVYDELEKNLEKIHDSLEDDYGNNVKIKYKIKNKTKIDKDDLDRVEDMYDEIYNMDVSITKGYRIYTEVTVKGKEDKKKTYQSFAVYKIKDAGWKLYPGDGFINY